MDIFWGKKFVYVILSYGSWISWSGSERSVFVKKYCLTINFALFNRTVKFNDSPINTILRLCLLFEVYIFSPASPHDWLIWTLRLPKSLSDITTIANWTRLVTPHGTWLGYGETVHLSIAIAFFKQFLFEGRMFWINLKKFFIDCGIYSNFKIILNEVSHKSLVGLSQSAVAYRKKI